MSDMNFRTDLDGNFAQVAAQNASAAKSFLTAVNELNAGLTGLNRRLGVLVRGPRESTVAFRDATQATSTFRVSVQQLDQTVTSSTAHMSTMARATADVGTTSRTTGSTAAAAFERIAMAATAAARAVDSVNAATRTAPVRGSAMAGQIAALDPFNTGRFSPFRAEGGGGGGGGGEEEAASGRGSSFLPSLGKLWLGYYVTRMVVGAAERSVHEVGRFLAFGAQQTAEKEGFLTRAGSYLPGGRKEAIQYYEDLQGVADRSPLQKGEIATAAQAFLAQGLGRNRATRTVQAISDLLAGPGVTAGAYGRVAAIIGRGVESPQSITRKTYGELFTLTTGEITQAKMVGALARAHFAGSTEKAESVLKDRKVGGEWFRTALEDLAEERNRRVTGRPDLGATSQYFGQSQLLGTITTIQDRFKETFRDIVDGSEMAGRAISGLNEALLLGSPLMNEFKRTMESTFTGIIKPWIDEFSGKKTADTLIRIHGLASSLGELSIAISAATAKLVNAILPSGGSAKDRWTDVAANLGGLAGVLTGVGGAAAVGLTGGAALPVMIVAGSALGTGGYFGAKAAAGALIPDRGTYWPGGGSDQDEEAARANAALTPAARARMAAQRSLIPPVDPEDYGYLRRSPQVHVTIGDIVIKRHVADDEESQPNLAKLYPAITHATNEQIARTLGAYQK
jgi:hypothetical protein